MKYINTHIPIQNDCHKMLSSQIVNPPLYDPARHMKLYIILLLMRISLHDFVN